MKGTISKRHLVTHAVQIIRHFGLPTYLRCVYRTVRTHGSCTFLDSAVILCDRPSRHPSPR